MSESFTARDADGNPVEVLFKMPERSEIEERMHTVAFMVEWYLANPKTPPESFVIKADGAVEWLEAIAMISRERTAYRRALIAADIMLPEVVGPKVPK